MKCGKQENGPDVFKSVLTKLDPETHRQLMIYCAVSGVKLKDVMIQIVEDFLKTAKPIIDRRGR